MKIILSFFYHAGDNAGFRHVTVDAPMDLSRTLDAIIDSLVVENPGVRREDIEITHESVSASLSLWDYVSIIGCISTGMLVSALLRQWLGW